MRRGLVSLVVLLFLALPVMSDAAATPPFGLVKIPIGGFAIGVPETWALDLTTSPLPTKSGASLTMSEIVQELASNYPAKLIVNDPANTFARFEVDALRVAPTTSELIADKAEAQIKKQLGPSAPVTLSQVAAAAGTAYAVHFVADTGKPYGIEEFDRYFLVVNQVLYVFIAEAPPADWSTYAATFARSVKSFQLLAPPNLNGLELQKAEVGTGYTAAVVPSGKRFIDVSDLNLCGSIFPSDNLRIGRLSMKYTNPDPSRPIVDNEVATYVPGGAQEALTEIKKEANACIKAPRTAQGHGLTAVYRAAVLSDPKLLPGTVAVRVNIKVTGGASPFASSGFFIYQASGDTLSTVSVLSDVPHVTVEAARQMALHAAEESGRNISGRSLVL